MHKICSCSQKNQRQWGIHLPKPTPEDQQLIQGILEATLTF